MPWRKVSVAVAAALMVATLTTGAALAGAPVRESASYTDTFHDDFILDLCGIDTMTTVIERWTYTEFPDGSATLHVVRTFIPSDSRIPIEKGAGTSFYSADGSRLIVGKPIQLFDPDGGVMLLDAGLISFDPSDEIAVVRGPHPSLDADLAAYYCP